LTNKKREHQGCPKSRTKIVVQISLLFLLCVDAIFVEYIYYLILPSIVKMFGI